MNVRRGLFHALFRVGQPAVNRHYDYYRKTQWLPRQELEALQFERTQRMLQHAYDRFPFYRAKFDAAGVTPHDFRKLSDLEHFPLTSVAELKEAVRSGEFASYPDDRVIELR